MANADGPRPQLHLEMLDRKLEVGALDAPLIFGRGVAEGFEIPDPRVSRLHAIIEPRGTQFVLVDSSSNGTWVQFDGQNTAIELRQQECPLHGAGVISFGIAPTDFSAPSVRFSITVPTGFAPSSQRNSSFSQSEFGKSTFGQSTFGQTGFGNTKSAAPEFNTTRGANLPRR